MWVTGERSARIRPLDRRFCEREESCRAVWFPPYLTMDSDAANVGYGETLYIDEAAGSPGLCELIWLCSAVDRS